MFEWERHFPQMKLEVRDYAPQELQKKLIEDELELIYTVGEVAPGLCRVPIANEPAGLLINETNPLASCTRLHSEQLRNEKFLLASQEPLPKEERDQLARYLGFSPQFVSFEGTFEEGPEHVRRNEGVLFCGFTYRVTQDMHGLVAVPFPAQAAVFRHFLAYRKDRKLSAPVRWLLAEQTHPQE
jgi:DNA-binding transcriptional LysR family regulator